MNRCTCIRKQLALRQPYAGFLLVALGFWAGIYADRRGWVPRPGHLPPATAENELKPLWETWNLVQRHYVDTSMTTNERLVQGAIRGMLESLNDPGHSAFLTAAEHDRFKSSLGDGSSPDNAPPEANRSVTCRILPGSEIAHLHISGFDSRTHQELNEALNDARAAGARSLILDVRGNRGGLIEQTVAAASEFLTQGVVFTNRYKRGRCNVYPVLPQGSATEIPLCVLIDQNTCSGAEILAAALQDHERAHLVGASTFGTGTGVQIFQLSDGSAIQLGVAEWLSPAGRSVWRNGVTPDVAVPLQPGARRLTPLEAAELTPDELQHSHDSQLLAAVELCRGTVIGE